MTQGNHEQPNKQPNPHGGDDKKQPGNGDHKSGEDHNKGGDKK